MNDVAGMKMIKRKFRKFVIAYNQLGEDTVSKLNDFGGFSGKAFNNAKEHLEYLIKKWDTYDSSAEFLWDIKIHHHHINSYFGEWTESKPTKELNIMWRDYVISTQLLRVNLIRGIVELKV